MKTYSRVYAKIDLDAVAWNMEQMKKNLKEGTEMVAVIKQTDMGMELCRLHRCWNHMIMCGDMPWQH